MALTRTGTEILLVYGAKLHPARNGRPGVRCTVDGHGAVLVEAVGYPCATTRGLALIEAQRALLDADLDVQWINRVAIAPALIARRKP